MMYNARIVLPVERGNFESYCLSYNVLRDVLEHIDKYCNIVSVEWTNGKCVATIKLPYNINMEKSTCSLEMFVRDNFCQNSGRNET